MASLDLPPEAVAEAEAAAEAGAGTAAGAGAEAYVVGGGGTRALWQLPGMWDLPGTYRPLLAFPTSLEHELCRYDDHTLPLVPSDLDIIEAGPKGVGTGPGGVKADPARDPTSTSAVLGAGSRVALRLSFELGASSYATMLVTTPPQP